MADPRAKQQPNPASAIVAEGYTYATVTDQISDIVTRRMPRGWYVALFISFAGFTVLMYAVAVLFARGVGIWGINIPVAWGFAIVNFVWWIGIGHAGTLISAILLLVHQDWRTSINRFAEAMTLFAVSCAGLFPLLHLGRPGLFYWMMPYPNTMGLWPQFRSPLVWDLFAVGTYFTISLVFWYIGLLPDLATLRDRSPSRLGRVIYGAMALGWRGSARHWERYETAYLLLAGLATPLVVSVHTVVSFDFAYALVPGWHSTIFPPYFVAGAIFSGFAMVVTLAIPLRAVFKLHGLVTLKHLDNMAKLLLATGLIVGYGYIMEIFMGFYSGDTFEKYVNLNRMFGPYAPAFWTLIACNILAPQFLWFRAIRRNVAALFVLSLIINMGMWIERYVIIITSLHRDYIPSSWGMYYPTVWDWAIYIGTIGMFAFLFLLFIRLLPMISASEVRGLITKLAHRKHKPETTVATDSH